MEWNLRKEGLSMVGAPDESALDARRSGSGSVVRGSLVD
jgi:hypothetical protein